MGRLRVYKMCLLLSVTTAMAIAVQRYQDIFEFKMKYNSRIETWIKSQEQKILYEQNRTGFSFKSCSQTPDEDLLIVHNLTLGPDPIETPGNVELSFNITIKEELKAPINGSAKFEKKAGSTWVKLPCFGEYGSCTYNDTCPIFQTICPKGMPCTCPFPPISFAFPKTKFYIPKRTPLPGDFRVTVNATASNGRHVGCYVLTVSIDA